MTHRFRALAAGLFWLVAATSAAPAGASTLREVTEKLFSFPPGGSIEVKSQNGRIVVEAWDRPQVRVQMTREVRTSDGETARTLMKQLTADVTLSQSRLRIVSVYPKREKVVGFWDLIGRGVQSANIHYYLQVPRATALDLSTANGEVRVRGTEGNLDANTTNGDVDVTGVRGRADVRTTNGEIRIARVEGLVDALTTNGSVAAEITKVPSSGGMELQTTNGNVQLALPRDVHAEVEANTTNGRVSINYNVTTSGVITSKTIRGKIGGGGARIILSTTNGNIDVGPPRRPKS